MKWIELKRSKIKVYGRKARLLLKGVSEEHTTFLHNLLTNDIKGMENYSLTYNLWLRQNGFPIGEFFVYKVQDFYILDTPLDAQKVIEDFERLRLSMKVYFEALDWEHVFVFGDGAEEFVREVVGGVPPSKRLISKEKLMVANNPLRLKAEGFDLMGELSGIKERLGGEPLSFQEWEDLRIEKCVPAFGKELKEGFSPLEAGVLESAISLTKGCYVGQEAIARVYYRGKTPRGLVLVEGDGLKEGEKISLEGKSVGVITSVNSKGKLALAYMLRNYAKEGFEVDGIKVIKVCN
ncbi:MAG: folate-binding protein [Aquificota bacterium]|nr:MAG: folate-binding protein [Aquificota bacterium]